jgi:hypothetical protein
VAQETSRINAAAQRSPSYNCLPPAHPIVAIDMSRHVPDDAGMTPRKLNMQTIYLEPEKAALLDDLAAATRVPKAVLLREAVDDLLVKHGKLKKPPRLKK